MSLPEIPTAEAEIATLVSELIQIDSSNYGNHDGPGEAETAEYVHARLTEVGIEAHIYETSKSHRRGVVARLRGSNPERPALLLHGHLDVVPAPEPCWLHPPFSGEIDDAGMLWGRGAVDMKDMVGMILAVVRQWARAGVQPDRDIVVLFLPDEEAGGRHGSHWLVENNPEIFEGVTDAIGEVGGFSFSLRDDLRIYPIQVAEKGINWLRVTVEGTAGHGSYLAEDNAVAKLCQLATKLDGHQFPVELTPAAAEFVARITELTGVELDLADPQSVIARLGSLGRIVGATVRNTVNLTMLEAGHKANVIPSRASATFDGRFLPGFATEFTEQIKEILGDGVTYEYIHRDRAVETTFDGPIVDLMVEAIKAEDPHGVPVPYLMSGGTDAKAFSELGIRCFGFSPLLLPADIDFFGMFHAVNEHVPVSALKFGVRVLDRFLRAA